MTNNSLNNVVYEDFSVENGASGATRRLRVENTNDTASSDAAIETQVGGTSADDTYIRHVISTTNSFAHGIDNTDSQSFDLAYAASAVATPSSTKAIKSTTDGELLYPSQPLFATYRSSTLNNVTGDGTDYTILFNTVGIDQDSNYSTGTGRFTAPKDGIYLFTATAMSLEIGTHNTSYFRHVKNGTEDLTSYIFDPSVWKNTSNAAASVSMVICELSANDYVEVRIRIFGSTKTVDLNVGTEKTHFGGTLLG